MLLTKDGIRFADPILNAAQRASELLALPIRITSGTDGAHSGPDDPHHSGHAYDFGSHEFADKEKVLDTLMGSLDDGPTDNKDDGIVTTRYFGWLEAAGTPNEHFHVQLRRGQP